MEAALAVSTFGRGRDGVTRSAVTLKRIATTRGAPETAFYEEGASTSKLDSTCEMLRIWNGLKGAKDCGRVLAFAQGVAAQADAAHAGVHSADGLPGSSVDDTDASIAAPEASDG